MGTMKFGQYVVETSNEDKEFYPKAGYTKGDLIEYYRGIFEIIQPYLEGRPVSMHRYPDGIEGEGFYQKDRSEHFPDWIDSEKIEKKGGTTDMVVIQRAADLVYLANQGCITPHVWLSRRDKIHHPDQFIFDLDPGDAGFDMVVFAAKKLKELFEEVGLTPFVKTTGSKGLHLLAPLDRSEAFDPVRDFAHDLARVLAARFPDRLTVNPRKEKRKGKIFLDYLRNSYAQTAAPPYSVRARESAPVATPVDWGEVGAGLSPTQYTIKNIQRRLSQKGDPWSGMMRHARSLKEPRKKLDQLLEEVKDKE